MAIQQKRKSIDPSGFSANRRNLLLAGIGLLLSNTVLGEVNSTQKKVILGQVSLSFYAVTGAVVHEVLELLGHEVELVTGPHEQIFPLLGDNKIDLMAAAWLPEGHSSYWARYGANAQEVTQLYEGARFFLAVPSYIPESEVKSIADLSKPGVTERMAKLIQGIGPGATISTFTEKAIDEYGLRKLGYHFKPGTQKDWIDAYNAAIAKKRWVIFPTWAPQYLNKDNGLRALNDPLKVLGGVNHASIVAPKERFRLLPEKSQEVLSRIELGLDSVTYMDWLVNVEKLTPREAARKWMRENETRVKAWLAA
jgi:glycine betaine/proline transport system substrate-binding protein